MRNIKKRRFSFRHKLRTVQSKKHKTTKGKGELTPLNKVGQLYYLLGSKFPLIPSKGKYNITVAHSHKFIWFRVPKVGTRTILEHLRAQNVSLDAEYAFQIHYPPLLYKDYFKFDFIRNPWDRIVSCWRNKVVSYNHFGFNPKTYETMQAFKKFVEFVSGSSLKLFTPQENERQDK